MKFPLVLLLALLPWAPADANLVAASTSGGGGGGGIAHVQDGFSSACAGASTCPATMTGTGAGNFIAAVIMTNNIGASQTVTSVTTNSTPATCTHATGANGTFTANGTNGLSTDIYYCPNIVGGSITVTAHLSGSPSQTFVIFMSEFSGVSTSSPDIGVGATATKASGSTTNVFLNVTPTQTNQLIISCGAHDDSPGTITASSNQIIAAGDPPYTYQINNTVASTLQEFLWTSNGAGFLMSTAVFSHP